MAADQGHGPLSAIVHSPPDSLIAARAYGDERGRDAQQLLHGDITSGLRRAGPQRSCASLMSTRQPGSVRRPAGSGPVPPHRRGKARSAGRPARRPRHLRLSKRDRTSSLVIAISVRPLTRSRRNARVTPSSQPQRRGRPVVVPNSSQKCAPVPRNRRPARPVSSVGIGPAPTRVW
jgi:hypothetical protein